MESRAGKMSYLKKIFLLILTASFGWISILEAGITIAQSRDDAGLPGAYLSWGVGGRALGMGKAYVSLATDATSPYWNSAGLADLPSADLQLQYTKLFLDSYLGYFGYGQPLNDGTGIGIGVVVLRSDTISRRDDDNRDEGTFNETNSAFIISYGYSLQDNLSIGLSGKWVRQSLAGYSSNGIGADLGLLYKPGAVVNIGLQLQNVLAPSIKLIEEADKFPLTARLGVSARFFQGKLIIATDADKVKDRKIRPHLGLEYTPLNIFSLRTGIDNQELTFGFGVRFSIYRLDYAYSLQEMGSSQRFSLGVKF